MQVKLELTVRKRWVQNALIYCKQKWVYTVVGFPHSCPFSFCHFFMEPFGPERQIMLTQLPVCWSYHRLPSTVNVLLSYLFHASRFLFSFKDNFLRADLFKMPLTLPRPSPTRPWEISDIILLIPQIIMQGKWLLFPYLKTRVRELEQKQGLSDALSTVAQQPPGLPDHCHVVKASFYTQGKMTDGLSLKHTLQLSYNVIITVNHTHTHTEVLCRLLGEKSHPSMSNFAVDPTNYNNNPLIPLA